MGGLACRCRGPVPPYWAPPYCAATFLRPIPSSCSDRLFSLFQPTRHLLLYKVLFVAPPPTAEATLPHLVQSLRVLFRHSLSDLLVGQFMRMLKQSNTLPLSELKNRAAYSCSTHGCRRLNSSACNASLGKCSWKAIIIPCSSAWSIWLCTVPPRRL